jgi:hypothetical protein
MWDMLKKVFDAWEAATAQTVEQFMKSPLILGPSGAMLTAVMKAKAAGDQAAAAWWGALGLPTKRDQERAMHAINELSSKIMDLEEQLADARKGK